MHSLSFLHQSGIHSFKNPPLTISVSIPEIFLCLPALNIFHLTGNLDLSDSILIMLHFSGDSDSSLSLPASYRSTTGSFIMIDTKALSGGKASSDQIQVTFCTVIGTLGQLGDSWFYHNTACTRKQPNHNLNLIQLNCS